MKLAYLISAIGNPLYEGNFEMNGSYKTYGQHSFIYDFVNVAVRMGIEVDVFVDDTRQFPLTPALSRSIPVRQVQELQGGCYDVILLDKVTDAFLSAADLDGFVIGINHNHLLPESPLFYDACDLVICLTENGRQHQLKFAAADKLLACRQGIDLNRFRPGVSVTEANTALIYSRMNTKKGAIYDEIASCLIDHGYDVTVLGDGHFFWEMADKYLDRITPINYIPCYAMHRFISRFGLVVSNGRGVMEGMACGLPVIAAGIHYGGLVTANNIDFLFERNFTCSNVTENISDITSDIQTLRAGNYHHGSAALARQYFDMSEMIWNIQQSLPAARKRG